MAVRDANLTCGGRTVPAVSDYFLTEEPSPEERQPRSRWVDVAGLAAIVAVILGVGILGDQGPRDESSTPETTTTTERRPKRIPYDQLTTTVPPATTTTTDVTQIGRTLEVETDTVLLIEGQGRSLLLDVDAGTLRRIDHESSGGFVAGVEGGFLTTAPGGLEFLSLVGDSQDFGSGIDGWALPVRSPTGTVWVHGRPGLVAAEYDLDGRSTGRRVLPPTSAYLAGVSEDGLVFGQAGSIVLVDPDDGPARSLGHGDVLGVEGRTVVRMVCEAFRCHVEAFDTRSGQSRAIVDAPVDGFRVDRGRFSPDGRWFAYQWSVGERAQELVLIDLVRSRRVDLGEIRTDTGEFSAAGDQLFVFDGAALRAYGLSTGVWNDIVPAGRGLTSGRLTATRG